MSGARAIERGTFKHQGGWITSICTADDRIVTASRDRTICVWNIDPAGKDPFIKPYSLLTGHNHIVQDLVLSSDGQYALSASWDKVLRLWDLNGRKCMTTFVGHTADVLSVSISKGNRQIISAGRDRVIKLWNIKGECKHTTQPQSEWITCAKFGLSDDTSPIVSAGYDRRVTVWDRATFSPKYALAGHTGYINSIAISPDSTLVASGGQDKLINIWDIVEGKFLYSLNAGSLINHIDFSPNRFWIAVSTDNSCKIFDLSKKACIVDLKYLPTSVAKGATKEGEEEDKKEPKIPQCLSCAFSTDGMNLFAGYSDNSINVWNIPAETSISA